MEKFDVRSFKEKVKPSMLETWDDFLASRSDEQIAMLVEYYEKDPAILFYIGAWISNHK